MYIVQLYIDIVCVTCKEELLDGGHRTSEALHFCWVELREYLEMICMVLVEANVSMWFFLCPGFYNAKGQADDTFQNSI